jgi:hypothetical protein
MEVIFDVAWPVFLNIPMPRSFGGLGYAGSLCEVKETGLVFVGLDLPLACKYDNSSM